MNVRMGLAPESYKATWGYELRKPANPYLGVTCISREAGRNDWVAAQLLIDVDEPVMLNTGNMLALSKHALWPQIRIAIEAPGLDKPELKIIEYVEDDDHQRKADILQNSETAEVRPGCLGLVWAEIPISGETEPGHYEAVIRAYALEGFGDEELLATLRVEITVYNVRLPRGKERAWHLGLWQHNSNIARKHETPLWSDAHFRVIESYVASLAGLGQRTVTAVVSEIPWSGQCAVQYPVYPSDMFEYSMISVYKEKSGAFRYDYSALERYVNLCDAYGIDGDIELIGLANVWSMESWHPIVSDYPENLRIRYLDDATGCYRFMREGDEIRAYIRALEAFLIEKGWIDRARAGADEPGDPERFKRCNEEIRKAAPKLRFKAAIGHVEFMEQFHDEIEGFVPILGMLAEHWESVARIRDAGKNSIYWYVCCGPMWPNTFICSPLLESRLIPVLTAFLGLKGFLRWNYTVWPEHPREQISYRGGISWPAGDTSFVYPAHDGRPLLTLRYKLLKRGGEDFDLLNMLRSAGKADAYEAALDCVLRTRDVTRFVEGGGNTPEGAYSLNDEDYQKMRGLALKALAETI